MENTRIIIIVNFHNDIDKGILKVLDDGNNERSDFVERYLFELPKNDSSPYEPRVTSQKPYLFLSKDKVQSEFFADWQILLITDIYSPDDYLENIFDKNTSVMYHTTPSNIEKFLGERTIKSKGKGQHEPIDNKGYHLINFLVNAYDVKTDSFKEAEYNNAIRKFIDWFPTDEIQVKLNPPDSRLTSTAKLNILHECLTSAGAASIDKSLLNENQKNITEFLSKQKDHFSEEYIRNLTELRMSLLGS